jgi:hypothetical protein
MKVGLRLDAEILDGWLIFRLRPYWPFIKCGNSAQKTLDVSDTS